MAARTTPPLPTRGTPNGFRDWWDGPDEAAAVRAEMAATERRLLERAAVIGAAMRVEAARLAERVKTYRRR